MSTLNPVSRPAPVRIFGTFESFAAVGQTSFAGMLLCYKGVDILDQNPLSRGELARRRNLLHPLNGSWHEYRIRASFNCSKPRIELAHKAPKPGLLHYAGLDT